MGVLALLVGLGTGGLFHGLENRRVERELLERALEGAQHFASKAMGLVSQGGDTQDQGATEIWRAWSTG